MASAANVIKTYTAEPLQDAKLTPAAATKVQARVRIKEQALAGAKSLHIATHVRARRSAGSKNSN